MKKRALLLGALLVVVLIALIITSYYLYYNVNKCSNQQCFYDYLAKCEKNSYLSETTDSVMNYKILGTEDGKCKVEVTLVQLKRGSAELAVLENQDMICYLPIGVQMDPENNLKDCHGRLKEEIQNIIIQRMHSQIVQNLGQINEETTSVLG